MMNTGQSFLKTYRRYRNELEPERGLWTWGITVCQHRLTRKYKCASLVGDVDNGGGCGCRQEVAVSLVYYTVNLKLL